MKTRYLEKSKFFRWSLDWAILTIVGLSFSAAYYTSAQYDAQPVSWSAAMAWQLLRFQLWALIAPLITWLRSRARSETRQGLTILVVHLPASVAIAFFHTLIFPVAHSLVTTGSVHFDKVVEVYGLLGVSNIVMGLVVYWSLLTANYAIDYYAELRAERNRSQKLAAQLAQAQLQALKMQLNPHFLFNTLNSISTLVLENPKAANRMIARLGDFLRLTLDNDAAQQVTLERELEFLKNYLEIERIRFQDRLTVNFRAEPQALNALVPHLILQPIVENAIKHGIAPYKKSGVVEICAARRGARLFLSVRDTGAGRPAIGNGGAGKSGIGVSNTRARLHQLYGNDYRLELINAANGGLLVQIEIPLAENAGQFAPANV